MHHKFVFSETRRGQSPNPVEENFGDEESLD